MYHLFSKRLSLPVCHKQRGKHLWTAGQIWPRGFRKIRESLHGEAWLQWEKSTLFVLWSFWSCGLDQRYVCLLGCLHLWLVAFLPSNCWPIPVQRGSWWQPMGAQCLVDAARQTGYKVAVSPQLFPLLQSLHWEQTVVVSTCTHNHKSLTNNNGWQEGSLQSWWVYCI